MSPAATVPSIAKAAIGPNKAAAQAAAGIAVEAVAGIAAVVGVAGATATASVTKAAHSPAMLANSCMAAYI